MTLEQTMQALESMGSAQTRKIFANHGIQGEVYGVKVGDMKKLQKKIKKDHPLALQLFDTGNYDAQYFASMIADEKLVTKTELNKWAKKACGYSIGEYSVAWLAADSGLGWDLALKWIESKQEKIATAGWATLSSVLTVTPNDQLDYEMLGQLLDRVHKGLHEQGNRVRYTMNGFVIALGVHVPEFTERAKKVGLEIGKVSVNMGKTACKVPYSPDYIKKVEDRGRLGTKKKMARC